MGWIIRISLTFDLSKIVKSGTNETPNLAATKPATVPISSPSNTTCGKSQLPYKAGQ